MKSEWKEYKLGDITEWSSGGTPSKSKEEFWGGSIPWISASSMEGNRYSDSKLKVTKAGLQAGTRLAEKNSILLLVRGSILHQKIQVGITEREVTFNQDVKAITPKGDIIDPWYLLFWFMAKSEELLSIVENTGIGAGKLDTKVLHNLSIKVPPINERLRIKQFAKALDDKIQLNRQTNQTLEQMAQALFKSWFVDFDPVIDNALAAGNPIPPALAARAESRKSLQGSADNTPQLPEHIRALFPDSFTHHPDMGWIPEGWGFESFGKVSNCFDRHRIPLSKKQREEKQPGCIPYIGATSVNDFINEWIFDDIYLLIGEDGSVMKEDGSPFVQYIWGKNWVNNHAHVLQGANGISTEHLMLFMQAQNITAYVTGAVQLKINQKNMNSIPFLKACDDINQCFAGLIMPLYEKFRATSEVSQALQKLRDTLLPKLISGELRLPDTHPPESKAQPEAIAACAQ